MDLILLGPGGGVEGRSIGLIDVANDADGYGQVRAAFEEHSLLVFSDQDIADDV